MTIVQGPGPSPDIAPLTDDSGSFTYDGLVIGEWQLRALSAEGQAADSWVWVEAERVATVVIEVAETPDWVVPEIE